VRFGLAEGDILVLSKVTGSGLRLERVQDFCAYPWQRRPLSLRDSYLDRFFAGPLTHVAADGISIPGDFFPLPAGTRVRLVAMDRKAGRALYLWKTPQD
jgi:hypothetical protein